MKNLFLVLSLVCSLCLQAKDGKIKYGKLVIYEGGVEKKQPYGQGFLKIIDPSNKNINYTEISGQFEGEKISNAKIISKHFNNKPINISNLIIISNGDKGKCTSLEIVIEGGATITSEFIGNINQKLSFIKLEDATTLIHYEFIDKTINTTPKIFYGSYSPDTLSPTLTTLKYNKRMVKAIERFGFLSGYEKFVGVSYQYAKKDPFSYIRFLLNDDSYAIGNKIFYANKDSVVVNENSWSGTHTLSDGTKVSSDSVSQKLNIVYSNGETYTGTIKEGLLYPLYANVNEAKFTYDTGTHTANGVVTKWVNGETFEARHERLKSVLNEKWLAMVEEDKISEQEAIDGQRQEKQEKERKDLCANILWDKWQCKQIAFKGVLGASSRDNLWGLWGIDHTYFQGYAMLALDDNGDGVYAVVALPSPKVESRGRALQVNSFCENNINTNKQGRWHLEDNQLFINGEKTGLTLSNDGKTFKLDSLLGATLTIIQKSQETARKDE